MMGSNKLLDETNIFFMAALQQYPWPGNIRQLYNVVRQNVALSRSPVISGELVQQSLGEHAGKLAVSSTKSMIGHLLGAAAAVELVATTMSVHRGVVHPTLNYTTPDPVCDLDYVPNTAREMKIEVAISNSFGFGGQNAVAVFKRFEE